jgi:hypothetical protein
MSDELDDKSRIPRHEGNRPILMHCSSTALVDIGRLSSISDAWKADLICSLFESVRCDGRPT